MSNGQPPTQFQVVPPQGQRSPLGGGLAAPLTPQQTPAPMASAPVPPVQPSWARPQGGGGSKLPILAPDGTDVTQQVLDGIRFGAPVNEVQRFFPTATLEALEELAAANGLKLAPPKAQPAETPEPQGQQPAPAKPLRKRLNKAADLPVIERMLAEGATAEQISAEIGLNPQSVLKAVAGMAPPAAPQGGLARLTEAIVSPAAPQTVSAAPAAAAVVVVTTPSAAGALVPLVEQAPALARAYYVSKHVLDLSKGVGLSLAEIATAAELLDAVYVG